MRHRMAHRKLGRTSSHRRALFRNQRASLIEHERIITTVQKAKAVKPFIEKLVGPSLLKTGMGEEWIKIITFLTAMLSFTFLHVVIGELLPKSIAIRKSLATTLVIARPLHLFYAVFRPFIYILNGTANWLLKRVFKIDPVSEGEAVHSSEELALLVEESERQQEVTETEREILINALELNDVTVKDVLAMTVSNSADGI